MTLTRLASVILFAFLIACSGDPAAPDLRDFGQIGGPSGTELAEEQILHRDNEAEPQTLDPHRAQGSPAGRIMGDLYEPLIAEAPNGDLVPGAAESWTISEDGRVYTFRLREDGLWSNGDPVTAHDWVFSLRRGVDPATLSVYSGILFPIENAVAVNNGELPPEQLGVRAIDALTLEISLENPTPYFLGLLNHSMTYAVHPPSVREHGEKFSKPGNLVSNGPYVLKDWVVQSHIMLDRNPLFRDNDKTTINRVYFYASENLDAMFSRYRSDELDFTTTIPTRQLGFIKRNMPDEYYQSPYLSAYYYGINTSNELFAGKPGLRLALSMAIDREIITEKILSGAAITAYGWVPPVQGYEQQLPEWAKWTREERHAEARRLYAEAGYSVDNPLTLEILYNTQQDHKRIAIAISAMWKQVLGVNTQILNQEWKVYLQSRTLPGAQVFRSGWIGDYNDANTFAEILHSQSPQNDTNWSNPRYDELVDMAGAETDLEARAILLQEAEQVLLAEVPLIPIYFYVAKHLIKPWLGGYVPNIMDHTYTKDLYILKH